MAERRMRDRDSAALEDDLMRAERDLDDLRRDLDAAESALDGVSESDGQKGAERHDCLVALLDHLDGTRELEDWELRRFIERGKKAIIG
jgi:hypothetical protein